jgi:hypothetical protein
MEETITRLQNLIHVGVEYITSYDASELMEKPNPDKWSKKEIIGHLIDSGLNNIQRFTEIQFEKKPYKIRSYNQDKLVKANFYQETEIKDLLEFWIAINKQIIHLMKQQSEESLKYELVLPNESPSDLRFLMTDYVDHFEHHIIQLKRTS